MMYTIFCHVFIADHAYANCAFETLIFACILSFHIWNFCLSLTLTFTLTVCFFPLKVAAKVTAISFLARVDQQVLLPLSATGYFWTESPSSTIKYSESGVSLPQVTLKLSPLFTFRSHYVI